ncbi:hypothetical protein FOIG_16847 [Fusarium odoratissimum NRRL 54006]|uniref:Uncharacterized protein n=1 Tax=Fusarium odoratissimum (strain NRRL 54006) TaxID=1089451 RepID=X0JYD6_FUSO5|nr:uncharacterized protein FOIG_16847 [Fusarium odoratissimum NRRL 54006]EXL89869.1 hypothetical protein FOIG_16847 [Fusarium odoratissimum NRRL 54006]
MPAVEHPQRLVPYCNLVSWEASSYLLCRCAG